MPFAEREYPLAFSLFAGDLVQDGRVYPSWKKEFFDPLAPLNSRTPIYPPLEITKKTINFTSVILIFQKMELGDI